MKTNLNKWFCLLMAVSDIWGACYKAGRNESLFMWIEIVMALFWLVMFFSYYYIDKHDGRFIKIREDVYFNIYPCGKALYTSIPSNTIKWNGQSKVRTIKFKLKKKIILWD